MARGEWGRVRSADPQMRPEWTSAPRQAASLPNAITVDGLGLRKHGMWPDPYLLHPFGPRVALQRKGALRTALRRDLAAA